jgi:phenylalanyl-tRNA synthetase alpha chain
MLIALDEKGEIANIQEHMASAGFTDDAAVTGVVKSLAGFGYIEFKQHSIDLLTPTDSGEHIIANESPEVAVYNCVSTDGTERKAVEEKLGKALFKDGNGPCMKNKWIKFDKAAGKLVRLVEPAAIVDATRNHLIAVKDSGCLASALNAKVAKDLKRRKFVKASKQIHHSVSKGPKFARERKKLETDLTAEFLKADAWTEIEFKQYNFRAKGEAYELGALHPLLKVRAEFRNVLLEMGFSEMPTNNWVESSFWNFDSLFQPQQHPARDAHDTFFTSQPRECKGFPPDYLERVKNTHEKGGFGSIGYRYDWSEKEASKNILRTHTTAVSAQMLYKLAQQKPFKPMRYFSIDRVFRNESLDATHLAEFHQVEGLVADRNLTLGDLLGTIKEFFERIGIERVSFKPAYNPYTEPSMEIFGYSPQLGKEIEVGNSGVFRPEMLRPMGLPEDVTVIAWGLGLERPTMIKYGIGSIRDLFGPKVKLPYIVNNPIARFDKK